MTTRTDEEPLTERYLLGDLPEEERDRLELRLLEDPHAFEKVEAAETELIDRYVRDELTADERRRFERNLLPSGRISERVALARRLHRTIDRTIGERRPEQTVTPFAPKPAERPAASAPVRLAWAATILLALAAGALGVANLRLQDRLDRADEARLAAVEAAEEATRQEEESAAEADRAGSGAEELRRSLAEREEEIAGLRERIERIGEAETGRRAEPETGNGRAVSASLFLALATRSIDGREVLRRSEVEPDTAIDLQLDLDRLRPEGTLTVTIERDGVTVWRDQDLEPTVFGNETMARLVVPEEVLLPGTYQIEIYGARRGDDEPVRHVLTVGP